MIGCLGRNDYIGFCCKNHIFSIPKTKTYSLNESLGVGDRFEGPLVRRKDPIGVDGKAAKSRLSRRSTDR